MVRIEAKAVRWPWFYAMPGGAKNFYKLFLFAR